MDIKAFGVKKTYKKDKTGKRVVTGEQYFINPIARYVKPYTMVPNNKDINPTNPAQIVLAANANSGDVTLEMQDEGLFEGAYLTAVNVTQGNPSLLVELTDPERRVSITGRPCHISTIIGTGQRPFVLPESLVVDRRQALVARFFNTSASQEDIWFQIHGQRFYSDQIQAPKLNEYIRRRRARNRRMSAYMCPLDVDPVMAAGAVGEYYFTNDRNIYFEVRKITVFSTASGADIRFRVIDEKNNGMSSGWLTFSGSVGTAQYPFIFYGPWMVVPGGKLTFQMENLSAYEPKLYITLSGRQHFVYPGP